ncbi:BQ2448_2406 [Microbotryum intermedium]|uniref:BQ2448_2406 protein n=1 Tax=Microbotryum intermedium TaxID=269621 RepID=A0A238FE61_9BASI|nr:BQ2448_2406 [Microbotryum intermedium]
MNSIVDSQREILLSVEGSNLWSGNVVQSYNAQLWFDPWIGSGCLMGRARKADGEQNIAPLFAEVTPRTQSLFDVIGSPHQYGPHNKYFLIPLAIVFGFFVPVPFWIAHRIWPKLHFNQIVGINSSIMSTFLIAIWAQFYLRRRRPTFFRKYNYLLAAALDGGTDFMVFISTFSVNGGAGKQYTFPTWALNPDGAHYDCKTPVEGTTPVYTVSLEDDPSLPIHTVRMWTLGLWLTCFGAVLGQIFTFRPQQHSVSALFCASCHRLAQDFAQSRQRSFWAILNPGPFNIKKHVCVTVMASTASGGALAILTFAAEKLFSSQFFGYGLGGLYRSILVYPTFAVWPGLSPRDQKLASQKRRYKFLWGVFVAIFVWEWFPEIIAPTLTGISVFCLANRTNPNFTIIFGGTNGNEGLGLFSLGIDWLQIPSGCLYQPWATTASQGVGVILCIAIAFGGYYGNVWNAKAYPFMGQDLFHEVLYDQTVILDSNFNLNKTALAQQVYYFGLNLSVGASFTHVFLWYRKHLVAAYRKWRINVRDDPHYAQMQRYPECSMWVYGATVLAAFAMACATLYTGHSNELVVGCVFAFVELPSDACLMSAITGSGVSGSNMCQMLGSAIVPGNARASLYFQLYSSNSVAQGSTMVSDLKYTKVPPRAMFMVQAAGTLLGAILNLIIMNSIVNSQRTILLSVEGSNLWSGNVVQSYNAQAISWGALGKEMYGPHNKYFLIPLAVRNLFLRRSTVLGLFVPLPFWLAHRFWPKRRFNEVVTPMLCWSLGYLSVGIKSSLMSFFIIAIVSQFYLRRHRPTFFRKYNYVMAAALDVGTDFMVFISTFSVNGGAGKQYTFPNWALNPANTHYDYCSINGP